ncbi:Uncharacterised protein [Mycobacteroides abscessus subsp. abscessus]|nr:Uncharacterised protein [Mycobacteroides abscessus subsp. abscessus]
MPGEESIHTLAQCVIGISPEMVPCLETGEGAQAMGQAWRLVDVDVPVVAAISESVGHRRTPHMDDSGAVEAGNRRRRVHSAATRCSR